MKCVVRLPSARAAVRACALLAILVQMIGVAPAAHAQSFLEALFGGGGASTSQRASRSGGSAVTISPRPGATGAYSRRSGTRDDDDDDTSSRHSGNYTTMCVRMCDGFYFPINHKVARSGFYRDAEACRSRCGASEARLFYRPASSGDMKDAVDLTGRSYAKLPIAFLHRKQIVQGCTCRPEPWSTEAQARHDEYAAAEGRLLPATVALSAGVSAGPQVVAGAYDQAEAGDLATAAAADDHTDAPVPEPARQLTATEPQSSEAIASDNQSLGRLPGNSRKSIPVDSRKAAATAKPAAATARKPTKVASGSGWGLGGPAPKWTWPGDAPARVR